MNSHRKAAVIIGVLFIMASASAIAGFMLYGPILTGPDYLVNGAAHTTEVIAGALMELTLVLTGIGTAIGLFPVLRPYGERIALGHLLFRFMECAVITVGVLAMLVLLTLSQEFVAAADPDTSAFLVSGSLLHAVYRWTMVLGPLLLLGVNTLMYSTLLFKSGLVPRLLAGMGITGAVLVFVYGLLVMFGVVTHSVGLPVLMAMPIAFYEMILAVWLITKGFNAAAIVSEPARTTMTELLSAA